MANNVSIKISAKDEASSAFDRLQAKVDRLGPTGLAKDFLTGAIMGGGIAAADMLMSSVGSVVGGLGDMAKSAMEDEASVAKLTQAVRANDEAWDGNIQRLDEAQAAGQALAFTDDDVRDSLTRLVTSTNDANEAIQLNRVAMDLARLKGIGLAEAANLVAKAHDGQWTALNRAGISMDGVKTSAEALIRIQKDAAGQAEEYANKLEGRTVVAQIKMDEAGEKFGREIAPMMASATELAADAIVAAADAAVTLTPAIEDIGEAAAETAMLVGALAGAIEDLRGKGWWEYGDLLPKPGQMEETRGWIGDMGKGWRTAGEAAGGYWGEINSWVGDTGAIRDALRFDLMFDEALENVQYTSVKEAKAAGAAVVRGLTDGLSSGWDAVESATEALMEAMKNPIASSKRVAKLEGELASKELAAGLKSADPVVREQANNLKAAIEAELKKLRDVAKEYGRNTGDAYADGIGSTQGRIAEKAAQAVAGAQRVFAASSPPGPESPLHLIDVWGERTGEAWTAGLITGVNTALTEVPSALAGVGDLFGPPPSGGSGGHSEGNPELGIVPGSAGPASQPEWSLDGVNTAWGKPVTPEQFELLLEYQRAALYGEGNRRSGDPWFEQTRQQLLAEGLLGSGAPSATDFGLSPDWQTWNEKYWGGQGPNPSAGTGWGYATGGAPNATITVQVQAPGVLDPNSILADQLMTQIGPAFVRWCQSNGIAVGR